MRSRTKKRLMRNLYRLMAWSFAAYVVGFTAYAHMFLVKRYAHNSLPMAKDIAQQIRDFIPAARAAEIVPTPPPPTVPEVLRKVCMSRGHDTSECVADLWAMAKKESGMRAEAVGDQSRSVGYFQIRLALHGVADECATDLACSAAWTLDHLGGHGYFDGRRTFALAKHNGSGKQAELYAVSVKAIAKTLRPEVEKLFTVN